MAGGLLLFWITQLWKGKYLIFPAAVPSSQIPHFHMFPNILSMFSDSEEISFNMFQSRTTRDKFWWFFSFYDVAVSLKKVLHLLHYRKNTFTWHKLLNCCMCWLFLLAWFVKMSWHFTTWDSNWTSDLKNFMLVMCSYKPLCSKPHAVLQVFNMV